jgi:hypothetical protein
VGTFFASRRNQVIVAGAAIVLLIVLLLAFNLGRGGSYFLRSVIGFSSGAFRITDSSHAPERGPGNLAPPP